MAAKIAKIQLEMKNGVKVRTISELKDNFDAEKLAGLLNYSINVMIEKN